MCQLTSRAGSRLGSGGSLVRVVVALAVAAPSPLTASLARGEPSRTDTAAPRLTAASAPGYEWARGAVFY
jgi:hypothetical protein